MALPFPNSNMVSVTVKPNQRLEVNNTGNVIVFTAGQTTFVPAAEAIYLRRDGIVT